MQGNDDYIRFFSGIRRYHDLFESIIKGYGSLESALDDQTGMACEARENPPLYGLAYDELRKRVINIRFLKYRAEWWFEKHKFNPVEFCRKKFRIPENGILEKASFK